MQSKFFVIVALAVACSAASALDQAEEDKEIGLLLGNERLFAPYCLNERVAIITDIKSRAAERSSIVFEIFFGAATEIADEVMDVERQAVQEFAKEIQNPSEQVSQEPLPEDKIQALIEEGKREIQAKSNIVGRLVAATKNVVGPVFYNTANSALFVRLAKARSLVNAGTLLRGIVQTCSQVAEYEAKLEADLIKAKEQLKTENSSDESMQKFIDSMSLRQLKCYTSKYVTHLHAFCRMFKDGSAPFMKMLGLGSDFKLPEESEKVFQPSA